MTEPTEPTATHAEGIPLSAALSPDQRRTVRICLSLLGALTTGTLIGVASSLYLVSHYPLVLMAISPLDRHLVLAAPSVDPIALVVVTVARRLLFYFATFFLGRALGPAGIPWIEQRAARFGSSVRWAEGIFARAPRLIVLAVAGPITSALAGVFRMGTGTFVPLAIVSAVVRVLIVLRLAQWAQDYVEIALVWINEYWLPGTIATVAGVAIYRLRRPRAGDLMSKLDELSSRD